MSRLDRLILALGIIMWSQAMLVRCTEAHYNYNCSIGETRCQVIDASECKALHSLSDSQPITCPDFTSFLDLVISSASHFRRLLLPWPLGKATPTRDKGRKVFILWLTPSQGYSDWSICLRLSVPKHLFSFNKSQVLLTRSLPMDTSQTSYQLEVISYIDNTPTLHSHTYLVTHESDRSPISTTECPLPGVAFTITTNKTVLGITVPPSQHHDLLHYDVTLIVCSNQSDYYDQFYHFDGADAWGMGDCPYYGDEMTLGRFTNTRLTVKSKGQYQLWIDCRYGNMPRVTLRTPTFVVSENHRDLVLLVLWNDFEPEQDMAILEWRQSQDLTDVRDPGNPTNNEWGTEGSTLHHTVKGVSEEPIKAIVMSDNPKERTNDQAATITGLVSVTGLLIILVVLVLFLFRKIAKKKTDEKIIHHCDVELEKAPSLSPAPSINNSSLLTRGHDTPSEDWSLHSFQPSLTPRLHRSCKLFGRRKQTLYCIEKGVSDTIVDNGTHDELQSHGRWSNLRSHSLKPLYSSLHLYKPYHDYSGFDSCCYNSHPYGDKTDREICLRQSCRNSTRYEKGLNKIFSKGMTDSTNSSGYYSTELSPLKEPRASLQHDGSMGSVFFNDLILRCNGDWNNCLVSSHPGIEHYHSDECISLTDSESLCNDENTHNESSVHYY